MTRVFCVGGGSNSVLSEGKALLKPGRKRWEDETSGLAAE